MYINRLYYKSIIIIIFKMSNDTLTILNATNWIPNKSQTSTAKPNKSGQGKSVNLTYEGNRFYLKTPKMHVPFGGSQPPNLKGGLNEKIKDIPQWNVQMVFSDDPENTTFLEKVREFDEFMINEAHRIDNNISWLGASRSKPFSKEVVESKYFPMLKHSKKDGEISDVYPPFIRIGLPTNYKNPKDFSCEFYDKDGILLNISANSLDSNSPTNMIPSGSYCAALIQGSIWCTSNGFGVTWKVAQIKIFPPKGSIPRGKCLVNDPDEGSEDESEEDIEE
jgi:hypothetical protein